MEAPSLRLAFNASMTMVPMPRCLTQCQRLARVRVAGFWLCLVAAMISGSTLSAQSPPVHYQHAGALPPGAIGSQQLQRGGPLPEYFQPVEIVAPAGAMISLAVQSRFGEPQPSPVKVGMLIAPVYRLRITNIPRHEGFEIYPTIEVVNRLYPPAGLETRYPVPIEITQQDIEFALDGKFVTRVIYLENPEDALPVAQGPGEQHWYEVRPHEDPLEVADHLGRPMAILRIGGRVPDERTGPDAAFMFGSPPVLRFYSAEQLPAPLQMSPDVPPVQGPAAVEVGP